MQRWAGNCRGSSVLIGGYTLGLRGYSEVGINVSQYINAHDDTVPMGFIGPRYGQHCTLLEHGKRARMRLCIGQYCYIHLCYSRHDDARYSDTISIIQMLTLIRPPIGNIHQFPITYMSLIKRSASVASEGQKWVKMGKCSTSRLTMHKIKAKSP